MFANILEALSSGVFGQKFARVKLDVFRLNDLKACRLSNP